MGSEAPPMAKSDVSSPRSALPLDGSVVKVRPG
jgi:hypothetical protein